MWLEEKLYLIYIYIQFPSKKRYPYISIFKSFELTSLPMEFLKGLEDIKFQLRFKLQKFYLTTFLTMMHCCCRCSQNSKLPQLSSRHFFMKNDEISTVKKKSNVKKCCYFFVYYYYYVDEWKKTQQAILYWQSCQTAHFLIFILSYVCWYSCFNPIYYILKDNWCKVIFSTLKKYE